MASNFSILLGLHDADLLESTQMNVRSQGLEVYAASTLEDMKVLMIGLNFTGYLMDLNLKYCGNIEPRGVSSAKTIYTVVRERVKRREAVFLGVSGRNETVELALAEHIPAEIKPFELERFILRCQKMIDREKCVNDDALRTYF
ncbi:MAG: hypothetical protein Q7K45_06085 [Nanoarchaeota archaeon]|nr:hypothetical protein [Nanoarchaeota archaeon]